MENMLLNFFAGFIAPIVAGIVWKYGMDIKTKLSGDADKVINRFPKVAIVAHDLLTEAKSVIPSDSTDKLISYLALGLKTTIKGKFDDAIIDEIAKKIVESRKRQ